MKQLLANQQFTIRDGGEWTNAGSGCDCHIMLPPLRPLTHKPFVIYGVEQHAIKVESIESDAMVGCSVAGGASLSADEAPGGLLTIRNVLGQKWHVMRVSGLGPSPANGEK